MTYAATAPSSAAGEPADQYQRRLNEREQRAAHCNRVHVWLGNTRLGLGVATLVLAWQALGRNTLSWWWLAPPIVAFASVAVYHSRVLRTQEFANRAISFYRRGLARIEDHWAGTGPTGARFHDPDHEYAADLDLFGKGGLFELLSTARTRMGEETLAAWLLAPASLATFEAAGSGNRSTVSLLSPLPEETGSPR